MKILVYGAGALGSLYAARLCGAGQEVTLLARGERLSELQENGIVLENGLTGERTTTRVPLVDSLKPEDAYELVLVMMGRHQTPATLPSLANNHHTPSIAFLGNNASGADEYIRGLGRERVLLGFAGAGGYRQAGAVRYGVRKNGQIGITYIGEPDGRISARLSCIASAFENTGLPVEIVPDMDAWLKCHAALILPLAYGVFLSGMEVKRMARTRDAAVLAVRSFRENLNVIQKAGIPVTPPALRLFGMLPEPLLVAYVQYMFRQPQAEIAFGHAAHSLPEMRLLSEQMMGIARRADVSTPTLDFLRRGLDPLEPPLPDGSATLVVAWREVWVPLAAAVLGFLVLRRVFRHTPGARNTKLAKAYCSTCSCKG